MHLADGNKPFVLTLKVQVIKGAAEKGGAKAVPLKEALDRMSKAIARRVDAEIPLDLNVATPIELPLKEMPLRVQMAHADVADFRIVSVHAMKLQPRKPGRSVLAMWFGDRNDENKQFMLTIQVRVLPE